MESHTLNKLAEKFWLGECTDAEEQVLKEAVLREEVPAGMEALVEYFQFVAVENQTEVLGEEFDEMILRKIEPPRRSASRPFFYLSVAAAVAVLFVSALGFYSYFTPTIQPVENEFVDTYQDSEEAYREVRKALMLVSNNMNQGIEPTQMLGEFHKAHTNIRSQKIN